MKVKYISANGKPEAVLSESSDWNLFKQIAKSIAKEFNGNWITKLNGFDQKYWDIEIGNVILTLHSEHYLGISLFAAEKGDIAADNLVRKIGNWFEQKND